MSAAVFSGTTPTTTTVIFGGSFNPPHLAHVLAICAAKSYLEGASILVVPTFDHPFGKPLAAFEHRYRMCELAFGWVPSVTVSRIEQELGGESRTLRTLQALKARTPNAHFRLLVGADIMLESSKWHAWDEVEKLAPPFVLGRAGYAHPRAIGKALPEISSSEVRAAFEARDAAALGSLLTPSVLAYAEKNALYTI